MAGPNANYMPSQEETKESLRKRRKRKISPDVDDLKDSTAPAKEKKNKKRVSFG